MYHYQTLRKQYTFEQLQNRIRYLEHKLGRQSVPSIWCYKISDMNESVIVAHIKRINEKNGYPSYDRQFKKQAKEIIKKYDLGVIRYALHIVEKMQLENEISFTFIETFIDKEK